MAECILCRGQNREINNNLFSNWYYKIPINSQQQTRYTSIGNTIDCVVKTAGAVEFEVTDDGLKITGGTSGYFHHYIDINLLKFAGLPITFSMIDSNNIIYTKTVTIPSEPSWICTYIIIGGIRFELVIRDTFAGYQATAPQGTSCIVEAVKLEFGDQCTLYKDMQPPDKALEQERCKYYFRPFCEYGYSLARSVSEVDIDIVKPLDMRTAPTIIPIYAASFTPNGWDTNRLENIQVMDGNNNVASVFVKGLSAQVAGEGGLGIVKGYWNANL